MENKITKRKYIDWGENYGKTFKICYTPKGAQSGNYKPGLISIVTPKNNNSWTTWKELEPLKLKMWEKKWDEIQKGLYDYKYIQIIQSQK